MVLCASMTIAASAPIAFLLGLSLPSMGYADADWVHAVPHHPLLELLCPCILAEKREEGQDQLTS